MPTDDAIQYTVYTSNGFMIEHTAFSDKLKVNNTVRGDLDPARSSARPDDFRQNVLANYTLAFSPVNYQQNLQIIITLPPQVKFSNKTLFCEGLAGTDYPTLNCKVDKKQKTITIDDAVTYQRGNPGTIKIGLSQLVNPIDNIITDSFKIETKTSTNF